MKLDRKTVITLLILFLFLGSIIPMALNVFFKEERGESNIAIIKTSKGTIEIELYPDQAPKTVENFKRYLDEGFYDGLVFHRVIEGFMIQAGGFYPDGVYKEPTHAPIESEAKNGLKNTRGTIAMARTSDPNSATSQFYINTVDNPVLDYPNPDGYGYTVFGKVIKGMDIVQKIESEATGEKSSPYGIIPDWPKEDIVIIEAKLKEN